MDFVIVSFVMVAFLVGVLVLVSRMSTATSAQLLDWKPTRTPEQEIQLEIDDLDQMLEANNAYRRKRGAAERTVGDWEGIVNTRRAEVARAKRALRDVNAPVTDAERRRIEQEDGISHTSDGAPPPPPPPDS